MARYRFISCHAVTGSQLSPRLNLIDAKWNEAVGGNGQLTAAITVPKDPSSIAILKAATSPYQAAVYVKNQDNIYPWGGPVVGRVWQRSKGQISITVAQWRSWPYSIFLEPAANADILYTYTNQDQLLIARSLMQYAAAGGIAFGAPTISYDFTQTSGKLRDLNFYGSALRRPGEMVDSMANRDGGFEWDLAPVPNTSTGLPQLKFFTHFPERGTYRPGLHFKSTHRGANCIPGDTSEDASQAFNRFWTTGSGQPPDQIFGYDIDPELATGLKLMLSGSANYNTIVERPTLVSHARRNRRFYASGVQTLALEHNFEQIDPDSYGVGDRGRLTLEDRWENLDLPQVRVVSKEIDTKGAGKVRVVLDLTDFTLPEVDTGGSV